MVIERRHAEGFMDLLNRMNKQIKFTSEVEQENRLAFLNIMNTRQGDGSISTSVFRKHIHTDQYLSYSLHHPIEHKRSVVRTLVHRENTCQ